MPWSEERIRAIIDHFGSEALLWILIMHRGDGETGVHVGSSKARNAVKLYSKVKSYAKNHGKSPPPNEKEIKQGYKRLLRVEISHPELGTATVIEGDKMDYVKLTGVGQRLVTHIHTEPDLKKFAKSEAGLNTPTEPKWPDEYDNKSASVNMTPKEVVSDLEPPFKLPTVAKFECPVCSESLTHEYIFEYPNEAWIQYAKKTCCECGAQLRHKVGDPYGSVERMDN